MLSIDFLTTQDVLQIHEDQITKYGGMSGVRDPGALLSALAQPQVTSGGRYLHTDVFHMAAAYLFHLCQNHPFHDGNKRTAVMATFVFLDLNGFALEAPESEFEQLVWDVARGKIGKDEIRTFLQKHSRQTY